MASLARVRSLSLPTHSITGAIPSIESLFLVGAVDKDGPGDNAGQPHRHDFNEFVYVTEGSGTHYVDFEAIPIEPPQLFLLTRNQVHHWECDTPLKGTLVLFRDEFLSSAEGIAGAPADLLADGAVSARPGTEERERLERLLAELHTEYDGDGEAQEFALRNLLCLLLVHCGRMAPVGRVPRATGLCQDFLRLVGESPSAASTVAGVAATLGVTPGYLYEVVVAQTGSAPGELLRRATLREAQRLLARTEMSCAQVAAQLSFEGASYFSRFFRRESGTTPSRFRERYRARLTRADGHGSRRVGSRAEEAARQLAAS